MITIDVADLVVIAGQVLGAGPEAALGQLDIAAAQAALAAARSVQAHSAGPESAGPESAGPESAGPESAGPAAAAAARLMHALLHYRPFPDHGEQVAVAAGVQFLAPPGDALAVIEGMARGRLSPADAAAWLLPRLSPYPASFAQRTPMPRRRARASRLLSGVSPVRRAGVFTPVTGFLPFTDDALDAVTQAQRQAGRAGLDRPGPAQFLLALTATGHGAAAEAWQRLAISLAAVREQLAGQQSPRGVGAPHTMRVMPRALAEAVIHGHDYIGTEHILLALFHVADDTAAQALARLGAAESEIRSSAATALRPGAGQGRPGHRRGRKSA